MKNKGNYINIDFINNNFLLMSLNNQGKEYAKEMLEDNIISDQMLFELLEDFLCNGWNWILPEEIGALTDAPIISDSAIYNDHGELEEIGYVFAYMDYQVCCPVEQMLKNKSIIWEGYD